MLDTLNWKPLSQRRTKNRVTMLYKIINNQVTIDPNSYLNKSDTGTRGEHKYKQIATSKNIYKYFSLPTCLIMFKTIIRENKQQNKKQTNKQTNKQQQNTKTKNKIKQNKTNFKVKNQHFPDGRLNCLSLTELSESECYK